ncbi:unnamed protein product [Orchesella dallaii]|uniref:Uncharacterized protein n=1 Tax=Orchesella dallaii TaxID=48710 RepID=A0ABP1RN08_9HEXA
MNNFIPFSLPLILVRYDAMKITFNDGSRAYSQHDSKGNHVERTYLLPFEKVPSRKSQIVKSPYKPDGTSVLLDAHTNQSLNFDKKLLMLLDNGLPSADKVNWKPWLCARHLYLFPPLPKEGSFFYHELYEHNHCRKQYQYLRLLPKFFTKPVLTTRPTYHILITTREERLAVRMPWVYSISDAIFGDGTNLFDQRSDEWNRLIGDTIKFHPSSGREMLIMIAKQLKPNTFELNEIGFFCKHCDEADNSVLLSYQTIFNNSNDAKSRQDFESRIANFYPRIKNSIWKSLDRHYHFQFPFWFPYIFDEKLGHYLTHRETLSRLPTDLLLPFQDVKSIWAVMGNYNGTVIHRREENFPYYPYDCLFPFLYPEIEPVLDGLGVSDISIRHKNLKFIACSIPDQDSLFFQELHSIFNYEIWIALVISIIILSLLTSSIIQYLENGKVNCKKLLKNLPQTSIFDYIITLLEQGGIISKIVEQNMSLKFMVTSYVLVGIVLSNAYKNENITRLTLPRSRAQFQNFSELVEHNFHIFSRVIDSSGEEFRIITTDDPRYRLNMTMSDQHKLFMVTPNRISVSLFSEILFYADKISKASICRKRNYLYYADWISPFHGYCENATQLHFLNNTRIHPRWKDLAVHNTSVANVMNQCNKTAFVLPEDALLKTYNELMASTLPEEAIIHRGEDKLFGTVYGLKFGRWINPFVLQRFQWFTSAGIFDEGNKIAGFVAKLRTKKPTGNENEPKASNMRGNIAVVFVLLPIGYFFSGLGFFYEVGIIKLAKRFEAVYYRVRDLFSYLALVVVGKNMKKNHTIKVRTINVVSSAEET